MNPNAQSKPPSPHNRTITLSHAERTSYAAQLLTLKRPASVKRLTNRILRQDMLEVLPLLPSAFVDLLILDPPYNLRKTFNGRTFKETPSHEYQEWLECWFPSVLRTLKPTASVYICGDWKSSAAIVAVASKYLCIRNRITWEREKGRAAARNWKNCSEDIWFCTASDKPHEYTFNADAVKLRRRVLAPYKENGRPKDWQNDEHGNHRLTAASNLWTDLTVPFWSMPENTAHPTQKPEKLLAKLLLASSHAGNMVFDPFCGSGTTAVVAQKLGRRFVAIEQDEEYACLALKRLALAAKEARIQGYEDEVFWERNAQHHTRNHTQQSHL